MRKCKRQGTWPARTRSTGTCDSGRRPSRRKGSPQGATHTAEIQYAFNNPQGLQWNDVDKKLADTMSSYWANFAAKGDPNGPGLPTWPAYKDMSKDRVMVLGDTVQVESTAPAEKLTFYNSAYARLMKPGTN
jgi:para-nitrobenzyl esterase